MPKPKKKKKSNFRKINDWLHLWLGLTSGLIVFIVSITGCFYAFQQEIKDAIEPWRFVEVQNKPFVPPSQLLDTAKVYMPNVTPTGLTYANKEEAGLVGYSTFENGKRRFTVVFMNPYTGAFLKKQQPIGGEEFDFFRFIIDGHRALWLPYEIGRPIVGVGTLIFVFLLISGLIMWWPKKWNTANKKKSFSINWKAKFKRLNYDLHNVLGFYVLIFAFVLGLTGLVWSFQWVEKAVYFVTSGGESKELGHHHPHSDVSKKEEKTTENILDIAYYKTLEVDKKVEGIYITPVLEEADDPVEVTVYHKTGTWYDSNEYFYDQYTLESLEQKGSKYSEASFADKLYMMNYDIHIGSVLGLPGKVLAFLISLICASLPITGFLVWWHKKK